MSRLGVSSSLVVLLIVGGSTSSSSQQQIGFATGDLRLRTIDVALDVDDDDEDGIVDSEQDSPPIDDTRRIRLLGHGTAILRGQGARVLWAGRPLTLPATVRLPADVRVQATAPQGRLDLEAAGATAHLHVRGLELSFHSSRGPIDPRTGALMPIMQVPGSRGSARSDRRFRVMVRGAQGTERTGWLMAFDATGRRSRVPVRLHENAGSLRSSWIELVTDAIDDEAPHSAERTLRVALRDRIEFEFGGLRQSLFVGRPAHEDSPMSVLSVRARAHVMTIGGEPVIGGSTAEPTSPGPEVLVERQVEIASSVWAQCGVRILLNDVRVAEPRRGQLLSIGDPLGLPSSGSAARFAVGEHQFEVQIAAGSSPLESAETLAAALRAEGQTVRVFRVPRAENAADDAADILLLGRSRERGFSAPPGGRISADSRQPIQIAAVELGDGLEEFSNRNSMGGTLEERALILPLRDPTGRALELFFVDHFSARTRQGEAFIFGDGGPLAGSVVLDRRGASLAESAFTLSHELGHILLDQPYHPDDLGEDSPQRLMDSNGRSATIFGPKRLTPAECARARDRISGAPFAVQAPTP